MCFVEDEKRQVLVKRAKALGPGFVEGKLELASRRPKARLETVVSVHGHGGECLSKWRKINPRQRLLQRERDRVVAKRCVGYVAFPHVLPL